jgi:hypothetical protein
MSRRIKKNGSMQNVTLDKAKKYKYDAVGELVESTGTAGDNEIEISGSKSSLRRVADLERNMSILATSMLTTDNDLGVDSPAQVKEYTDAQIANIPIANTADFVASGTLPNGTPVVLNNDGTVEAVKDVTTTFEESIPAGAMYDFKDSTILDTDVSFYPDEPGKFLVTYTINGSATAACVGIIDGTSITFGPESAMFGSSPRELTISFVANVEGRFLISYSDSGDGYYGKIIIGDTTGTSISFGSQYVYKSSYVTYVTMDCDPNDSDKFVISYRDQATTFHAETRVGTITGSTISFGSVVAIAPNITAQQKLLFDPNGNGTFVIVYKDHEANRGDIWARVGTVSGTTITFGADAEIPFSNGTFTLAFDANTLGMFVVPYSYSHDTAARAVVGTITGTSISFGSPVDFNVGNNYNTAIEFDPSTAGKFVMAYRDAGNSNYGTTIVGDVTGSSIAFGSKQVFREQATSYNRMSFNSSNDGKFVVVYQGLGVGTAFVGQLYSSTTVTTLTETNFLGTSTEAYTDGQTATIMLQGGLSTNQSGLVANATYYVQEDGTLGTAADTVSVIAGKAIGATRLLLKGI